MNFAGGLNFRFVKILQILYGFNTSRFHERNGVVYFSIRVLHFSAIFQYGCGTMIAIKTGSGNMSPEIFPR